MQETRRGKGDASTVWLIRAAEQPYPARYGAFAGGGAGTYPFDVKPSVPRGYAWGHARRGTSRGYVWGARRGTGGYGFGANARCRAREMPVAGRVWRVAAVDVPSGTPYRPHPTAVYGQMRGKRKGRHEAAPFHQLAAAIKDRGRRPCPRASPVPPRGACVPLPFPQADRQRPWRVSPHSWRTGGRAGPLGPPVPCL